MVNARGQIEYGSFGRVCEQLLRPPPACVCARRKTDLLHTPLVCVMHVRCTAVRPIREIFETPITPSPYVIIQLFCVYVWCRPPVITTLLFLTHHLHFYFFILSPPPPHILPRDLRSVPVSFTRAGPDPGTLVKEYSGKF